MGLLQLFFFYYYQKRNAVQNIFIDRKVIKWQTINVLHALNIYSGLLQFNHYGTTATPRKSIQPAHNTFQYYNALPAQICSLFSSRLRLPFNPLAELPK